MSQLNTNVSEYSITELLQVLNLDQNSTINQINAATIDAIVQIRKLDQYDKNIITFLKDARNRLINEYYGDNINNIDNTDNIEKINKNNKNYNETYDNNKYLAEDQYNMPYSRTNKLNLPITDKEGSIVVASSTSDNILTDVTDSNIDRDREFLQIVDPIHAANANILNPIRRRYITSIVNIDTFLRSDYLNTNPSNYIQEFAEPINNVISMALSSIEMPNIWYSFSKVRGSNYINVVFKNFSYGEDIYDVSYDIIIPDGNYTTEEMVVTLNNLFKYYAQNNPSVGNEYQNPIYYLRMGVDNITAKTTFRIITQGYDYTNADEELLFGSSPYEETKMDGTDNICYSPDMIIEFNFLNESQLSLYNELFNRKYDNIKKKTFCANSIIPEKIMFDTAGWMFGFRKPTYTMTINDTFFDPYTTSYVVTYKGFLGSEGIYGGLINTYLFLCIDDFNNNYKKTVISNSEKFIVSNDILAKIPIGSGSNTILIQEDKINKTREYFGPVNIKKMRIKLLDRFGNIIDLNNNNYTFTLQLTQLY
jgi:hypothetical protein